MLKTYKFRIYPKKSQAQKLEISLDLCRNLYNSALQERIAFYKRFAKSKTKYDQINSLPEIKELLPEYNNIHSQVLQAVLARLDEAFQGFFRRLKTGGKAGFPRFKNNISFNSFVYPQSGFDLQRGRIRLSKIGDIKIKQHRNLPNKIKTCSVIRSASGKWYACLTSEEPKKVLPKTGKDIGIDVGIKNFAVLSDGKVVSNLKFAKQEANNLARAQRKLSACTKGTSERYKTKKVISRIHERITNKRNDFLHQQSKKIVDAYDTINVEKLDINNMLVSPSSNKNLKKGIMDAAWNKFFQLISYKAENADKRCIEVASANTSKTCSRCGHIQKMPLKLREFKCEICEFEIDRDLNASINILNRGSVLKNRARKTRGIVFEVSRSPSL